MANPVRIFPCISSKFKKSGFTLLEVIVAISLTLLVLTLVYAALYYSSRSSAVARVNVLKRQELIRQFHRLRRQLINLYKAESGGNLLGEEGLQARHCQLYFLTSSMENYRGVGEVGYRIEHDYEGNAYLAYTEFPYPRADNRFAAVNPTDKWRPASALIKEFEVEYELSGQWLKEWKSDEIPDRIRITFWYRENEEDQTLKPYSFIVVPGLKSIF